jgi:hypothetical protein
MKDIENPFDLITELWSQDILAAYKRTSVFREHYFELDEWDECGSSSDLPQSQL